MIINNDSLHALKELDTDSIDAVITDPPYGYSFMGKDWDKAVPSVEIWQECLRVLKPGGWCMVMSAPRSDVQNAMISRLMEAGFRLDFTPIYWTYASGFPKAGNVGKLVDKRNGRNEDDNREVATYLKEQRLAKGFTKLQMDELLGTVTLYSWYEGRPKGTQLPTQEHYDKLKVALELGDRFDDLIKRTEADREVVGRYKSDMGGLGGTRLGEKGGNITTAALDEAKALDGSYTGFQPKPAVEVIIVAMKPLSEKTYVDQALKNGKGITWLDDARIPYKDQADIDFARSTSSHKNSTERPDVEHTVRPGATRPLNWEPASGRFPANLLVSDDVMNCHSKYFDLDAWADTLPFLAVPKASKSEKNKGLEHLTEKRASERKELVEVRVNSVDMYAVGAYIKERRQAKGITLKELNEMFGYVAGCTWWESTNPGNIREISVEDYRKLKPILELDDRFDEMLLTTRLEESQSIVDIANKVAKNHHPTVKPLKLMSYLITLITREGDTVLDPFVGSGTTVVAAKQLGRKGVGIEREEEYAEIARARLKAVNEAEEQLSLV